MDEKRWTIEIVIDEHQTNTRAQARLRPPGSAQLIGNGLARCNPDDANVPKIGDELAVARALSDLSHQLIEATARDIEGMTHRTVHLAN